MIRFDRAVISIGNLSVGGTGKTPMVAWALRQLLGAGRSPCIAMRGYAKGGRAQSDEEALHRATFPNVPVVARPDRAEGLIELFASAEGADIDVVVLDDGFQHRRIARDLDLVLIDATRDPFADHLLPRGWLREGVAALGRADGVVMTHLEQVSPEAAAALLARLREAAPHAALAGCLHTWEALDRAYPEARGSEELASLTGRRLAAACAIGNPGAFIAQAQRAAGEAGSVESVILRDHAAYSAGQVERIRAACAGAEALLTTAKDWTKLGLRIGRGEPWPCPVLVPRLVLTWACGEERLADLVRGVACSDDARRSITP